MGRTHFQKVSKKRSSVFVLRFFMLKMFCWLVTVDCHMECVFEILEKKRAILLQSTMCSLVYGHCTNSNDHDSNGHIKCKNE